MNETIIAGLPIPSTSPLFLATVGVHVALGLVAVTSGALAMLSPKRPGRHPWLGTAYFWSLAGVAVTAGGLSAVRWEADRALFALAVVAFAAAAFGRGARRAMWRNWPRLHIAGMGVSYIAMLTAFYVDNGKNLPLWRALPAIAFWIGPTVVGLPIVLTAMARHPLARAARR